MAVAAIRSARRAVTAAPRAVFLTTALAATVLDQTGKIFAAAHLGGPDTRTIVLGPIRLEVVRNTGAAFGFGRGLTVWITLLTLAALAALAVIGWRARCTVWATATGLIAGGALGNGIDRVARDPAPLRGAVIDWIKLPFYGPVFNLADLALRTGVLLALGLLWRYATAARRATPSDVPANTR